jgi:hypothetical protein
VRENPLRLSQACAWYPPFAWQHPPDGAGYRFASTPALSDQARDTIERGRNAMSQMSSRLKNGERPLGEQAQYARQGLS